ncbi:diguanylate cyclase [Telmatospirillum sp.]|uniref:CHASE domain-containing protein n=1 Tax=Telmatospirillum sp. TaxID=2079197 RepID=UPI002848F270|nr:diguanylate cyclase [Telmatospirillum sp.]MDR3439627.1 diguanylate cyclase [Telmatospirillum sp.]
MASPESSNPSLYGHQMCVVWAILMALLSGLVTFGVWRQSRESAIETARALFDLRVDELARALVLRDADYEQVLRGARGLLAANRTVSAREWHAYAEELNISSLIGLAGLTLLHVVSAQDIEKFASDRRHDQDMSDFALKTDRSREQYIVLSFIEPALPRTTEIIGKDLSSDPVRLEALTRARDTALPAATAPHRLYSEPIKGPESFSIYVPVYRSGVPLGTPEGRRRALWAYVGCIVPIENMIQGVIAGMRRDVGSDALEGIVFTVEDLAAAGNSRFLYDSGLTGAARDGTAFEKRVTIDISGRQWAIEARSLPALQAKRVAVISTVWTTVVALFGILLTGLTYALGVILENRANLRRAFASLAEREAELNHLAHSDSLTGLANRRHFFVVGLAELARARRHRRALSVLMMDVDHFKAINDAHGHGLGDETLKRLAQTCQTVLRDCDLIARMGGEEFAVLLTETDLPEAQAIAERLRHVIDEVKVETAAGVGFGVTVSIGAAGLHDQDETLEDVVRRADHALYAAKAAGRNRVVVFDFGDQHLFDLVAPSPSVKTRA